MTIQPTLPTTTNAPAQDTRAREHMQKTAEDFEAVFLSQMMQGMFNSVGTNELFGGGYAEDVYRSFMVDEYGKMIAANGGIGVADHVAREMLKMQQVEGQHMSMVIDADVQTLNLSGLISTTARLAQVLAEEADMLQEMKLARVSELQQEKLRLTASLEKQRMMLAKAPQLVDSMTPTQKEDLRKVVDVFQSILEENHKRLRVAKEVNMHMVSAMKQAVTKDSSHTFYGKGGAAQTWQPPVVSFTLDRMI